VNQRRVALGVDRLCVAGDGGEVVDVVGGEGALDDVDSAFLGCWRGHRVEVRERVVKRVRVGWR
jgi:hypothetical protein